MDDEQISDRLIEYKFSVEWKIYDIAGNEIKRGAKQFESKDKAVKYAEKIKQTTSRDKNAIINLRELDTNEVIRRFKKSHGKKNFKRQIRR